MAKFSWPSSFRRYPAPSPVGPAPMMTILVRGSIGCSFGCIVCPPPHVLVGEGRGQGEFKRRASLVLEITLTLTLSHKYVGEGTRKSRSLRRLILIHFAVFERWQGFDLFRAGAIRLADRLLDQVLHRFDRALPTALLGPLDA